MTLRLKVAVIFALLAASLVSGCGQNCTAMGCAPGADVVFSRALDASKTYDIEVVADGTRTSCSVSVDQANTCAVTPVWTTDAGTTVTADGTAYPRNGFAGLHVNGQPSVVQVAVTNSGTLLGSGKFEGVTYRGVEQNGPGCGTCQFATLKLEIP